MIEKKEYSSPEIILHKTELLDVLNSSLQTNFSNDENLDDVYW